MTTTQPTPRSSSPSPAAILPWHKAAAAACFEKTSHPFAKDIAESIARHDPAPDMAEALRDLLALTEALRDHVKHNLNGADLLAPASPRIAKARALLARINGHNPP